MGDLIRTAFGNCGVAPEDGEEQDLNLSCPCQWNNRVFSSAINGPRNIRLIQEYVAEVILIICFS